MTASVLTERQSENMAREWWMQVCDPRSGDAAARAKLRRCRSTNDVLTIPAGIRLAQMLGAVPHDANQISWRFGRALDVARVLAHVTEDVGEHPMRVVGWPSFPGARREGDVERGPKLSEVRFRRLLQTDTGEDLVSQFTRLVALMKGHANVAALSDAFRWWDHPSGLTKQRWAFEYFNAGAAMRSTNDSPGEAAE